MCMVKSLNKYFILFIIIACSGGGESPTDSGDDNGGDNTNPYELPNAVDYGLSNQVEIVTWNIRQFPQHSSTKDYVKNLMQKWNADIYFFQEMRSESELISMVDTMPNYSYVFDEESGNLGFALVYKNQYVTFNSKNELWADTPNNDDGDSDYANNASYQFADRPPMENYVTWSDGTKTINLYLIGIHYKCCGDDSYNANDTGDETTRRHHASLLLTDYILNNRANDNVIVLGDFNNVGSQSITNPTLSPFTDQDNFDSASNFGFSFVITILGFSSSLASFGSGIFSSWQGWSSSYSAAHLDHIIINQTMFTLDATSTSSVISLPSETGISNNNVDGKISDHQPVMYRFYP